MFIHRVAGTLGAVLALAVLTTVLSVDAQADSGMQVLQRWKLGGAGGWDHLTVDSMHRLFLSRSMQVDVVDTQSGKVLGTIPNTQGVHGIALAPDLHRGFTSNGRADSVTVAAGSPSSPRGPCPAAIPQAASPSIACIVGCFQSATAYDEKRGLVFGSNGEGTLTVVRQQSADHYSVLDTVKTQAGARTMALDPATGRVYLVTAEFGLPDSFTVLVVGTH